MGDESLHGVLAHVTPATRKKIMATGFGEIDMHIEYIQKSLGRIKKTKAKAPNIQLSIEFGE